MKQKVVIAGVGVTRFGNHMKRGLKSLAAEAIGAALDDAGIGAGQLQAAYMGNVAASVITGQVCVPGQVVLRGMGIGRIPVVNVENACATAATAFDQACTMITLGRYDVVLACGYEKLYHEDKLKTFSAFSGAVDVEAMDSVLEGIRTRIERAGLQADLEGAGRTRSLFMDIYVAWAVQHMKQYGTTREQFAAVSSKNSFPRQPQSTRAVHPGAIRCPGAGRTRSRLAAHAADVLADRGWCGRGRAGQRAQGTRDRCDRSGAGGHHGARKRVGLRIRGGGLGGGGRRATGL